MTDHVDAPTPLGGPGNEVGRLAALQQCVLEFLEKELGGRSWQTMDTAPRDRIVWLYHRSWAGGPTLASWNDRGKWWSAVRGAGSCLVQDAPDGAEAILYNQHYWYPAFPPLPN